MNANEAKHKARVAEQRSERQGVVRGTGNQSGDVLPLGT